MEDVEIVAYCCYCKSPIYENNPHVVDNNEVYHISCFQQMNTFVDSFGDNINYKSED